MAYRPTQREKEQWDAKDKFVNDLETALTGMKGVTVKRRGEKDLWPSWRCPLDVKVNGHDAGLGVETGRFRDYVLTAYFEFDWNNRDFSKRRYQKVESRPINPMDFAKLLVDTGNAYAVWKKDRDEWDAAIEKEREDKEREIQRVCKEAGVPRDVVDKGLWDSHRITLDIPAENFEEAMQLLGKSGLLKLRERN